MESPGISEEFTDWEEIEFPFDNQTSSSFPEAQHLDLEIKQDDLPFQLQEDRESPENAPSSPLPLQGSGTDTLRQQQKKSDSKLSDVMGEVKTVICAMGRKMVTGLGFSFRCPTFVPAAALAVVILAWMKIVQGRNHLLLLLREKDQRISQLLHQIAHMNEILSARRRVAILRIN